MLFAQESAVSLPATVFFQESGVRETSAVFFTVAFAVLFLFAVVVIALSAMYFRSRNLRLRTIQHALQHDGVDAETKRMLGEALTANSRRIDAVGSWIGQAFRRWGRATFFVAGWMTFVVSGACLVGMLVMGGGRTQDIQVAVFMTAVGFGLVSLPVAIGELRKAQPGAERR